MLTLKDQLIKVAGRFASARKLSESRVSTMAFGDGKVIGRLRDGSDLTTARYETSMRWFSANWPEGAEWPAEVPPPSKQEVA